jgi:hypothetical protein
MYIVIGIIGGGLLGATLGFFGVFEFARIMQIKGSGLAIGMAAFHAGFYLTLILGTLGAAVGGWRAWLRRRASTSVSPFESGVRG